MCIWSTGSTRLPHNQPAPAYTSLPPNRFLLSVSKTTPPEEAVVGADLELSINTPLGWKRALLQAKVLDPGTRKLRCDHRGGWIRLGRQLRKMRTITPGCAFLLVYVPGGELNGAAFGYSTWEQGFLTSSTSVRSSRFGATAIEADNLLHPTGHWRKGKVTYAGNGQFVPAGVTLSRAIIELLVCARGNWARIPTDSERPHDGIVACQQLNMTVSEISPEEWTSATREARVGLSNLSDEAGFGSR